MALHSAQEADLVAKIRKIHQDVIKTMPDHRIAEELAELAARADPEDTVDQVVLSEYEAAAVRRGLVTNPKKAPGFSAAQKKKLRLGWGRLAPGFMASERISTKPPMALALYRKGKKWGSGVIGKDGKMIKLVDDFKHSTAFAAAKSAEKTVLKKNPPVGSPLRREWERERKAGTTPGAGESEWPDYRTVTVMLGTKEQRKAFTKVAKELLSLGFAIDYEYEGKDRYDKGREARGRIDVQSKWLPLPWKRMSETWATVFVDWEKGPWMDAYDDDYRGPDDPSDAAEALLEKHGGKIPLTYGTVEMRNPRGRRKKAKGTSMTWDQAMDDVLTAKPKLGGKVIKIDDNLSYHIKKFGKGAWKVDVREKGKWYAVAGPGGTSGWAKSKAAAEKLARADAKKTKPKRRRKNPYVTHPKTGEKVWVGSKDIQKLPPGEVDPAQGMPREYMPSMGVHVRRQVSGPGYSEGGLVKPRGGTSSGDGTANSNPALTAAQQKKLRDRVWKWSQKNFDKIPTSSKMTKRKATTLLNDLEKSVPGVKAGGKMGWLVAAQLFEDENLRGLVLPAIGRSEPEKVTKRRRKNAQGPKIPELDKLGISYEEAHRGGNNSLRFFDDWDRDVRLYQYDDGSFFWVRYHPDPRGTLDDENQDGQTFERAVREATAEPNPKKKGKRIVSGKVPKGLGKTMAKRRAKARKNPIKHTPPKGPRSLRRGHKPSWNDMWGDGSEFGKVFHGQPWTVRITQDEKGHEVTFGPTGSEDEREWLYFSGTGDGDTPEILAKVEERIKDFVKNPSKRERKYSGAEERRQARKDLEKERARKKRFKSVAKASGAQYVPEGHRMRANPKKNPAGYDGLEVLVDDGPDTIYGRNGWRTINPPFVDEWVKDFDGQKWWMGWDDITDDDDDQQVIEFSYGLDGSYASDWVGLPTKLGVIHSDEIVGSAYVLDAVDRSIRAQLRGDPVVSIEGEPVVWLNPRKKKATKKKATKKKATKRKATKKKATKKRAPRKAKTLKGRAKRAEKKIEGAAKRAGKRIKKDTKAAGKDVKKFAKTKTGYGALGAGAGALLLGPIGAIAGAVGGSKLHDNPRRRNPTKEQHHSRGDRKWSMFEEDWDSYTISNSPEDLLGAYTAIVEAERHYAHAGIANEDGRGYSPAGAQAAGIRKAILERLGG